MSASSPKAIIVDDTSVFRTLARRQLESVGIVCDEAETCKAATRLLAENEYAVLVTELHLRGSHPYHLVMKLLQQPARPMIVVTTDIREPRMARHLFDEGVEEVLFKPVDYELLAAKLHSKVQAWQRQWSPASSSPPDPHDPFKTRAAQCRISMDEIETKLSHLTGLLPLSSTAFDVFNATRDDQVDAAELERKIAQESSLAVEMLRLANSSACLATAEKITSLNEAIVRVGRRKIGELALAHTAKATLTQRAVPWLNVDLIWKRSIAASAAADVLRSTQVFPASDEATLSALMQGLGRVVLASLYSSEYEAMIEECSETNKSMDELEQQQFPLTPSQVIARVLRLWNLPESVWAPLAKRRYSSGNADCELLDGALALGELIVGSWHDFDLIVDPSINSKLSHKQWDDVVNRLTNQSSGERAASQAAFGDKKCGRIKYARIEGSSLDLPRLVLDSFCELEPIPIAKIEETSEVVIDARAAAPYSLAPFVSGKAFNPRRIIIADCTNAQEYKRFGSVVSLPISYGAFRNACESAIAAHAAPLQRFPPTNQLDSMMTSLDAAS